MEWADLITGCLLLGGAFIVFTVMNYRILFMRIKKAERIPSPAPLFGGVAGSLLVICLAGFRHIWLILLPLLVDPGSIPLLIWFVICVLQDVNRKES